MHHTIILTKTIKTMKTRKYLNVTCYRKYNKGHFSNPLKLSEVYLISKLAQENDWLTICITLTSVENYNSIFGN